MTDTVKLLAIETSAEGCSAALYLNGAISEKFQVQPRGHSELILQQMDDLLREAGVSLKELDAIAYGRGPGSFTGVRIAAAVTQGTAYGADLPVVPVSTLAALAQQAFRTTGQRRLLTAFDARMKEVYWAAYEIGQDDLPLAVVDEQVIAPELVPMPTGEGWFAVGGGWKAYAEQLPSGSQIIGSDETLLCRAYDIALLAAAGFRRGKTVTAEQALPIYLRDRVAKTIAERQAAGQLR
ncbi:MAG: tRNA (adenosine(37)-N6)-threonylcarbamoyltransferase complex dimerization subunit type 1 TsaB [Candidatus Polarisedimenticolaceae bacterium]|nr:tRNA (adenosine(37)-N6)-threonylcarbamoyltransferase complex dimerization subunit type 1 TsaB [Candidatus Polarisedimenticolaceae bacterium]